MVGVPGTVGAAACNNSCCFEECKHVYLAKETSKYEKFMRYVEFMNRIYVHPKIEIEVRK